MDIKQVASVLRQTADTLTALGSAKSAQAIIDLLASAKVKGTPGEQMDCPIAKYLDKSIPGGSAVVDHTTINIEVEEIGLNFDLDTTPAMQKFIEEVDDSQDTDSEDKKAAARATKLALKYAAVLPKPEAPKAPKPKIKTVADIKPAKKGKKKAA